MFQTPYFGLLFAIFFPWGGATDLINLQEEGIAMYELAEAIPSLVDTLGTMLYVEALIIITLHHDNETTYYQH